MVLYPGIGILNPPGICVSTTEILYLDSKGEIDPLDPTGAKKGDDIGEISSLSFPLEIVSVWGLTYGVEVTYGTAGVFFAVK